MPTTTEATQSGHTYYRPHNLIELRGRGIWNVTEQRWVKSGPLLWNDRTAQDVARYFGFLVGDNKDWDAYRGCWKR